MSDSLRERAERRVDIKIKFYRNLKAYVIVNAVLAIINWLCTPEFWWVMFPVFFWGIGVLVDFLKAYILVDNWDSEDFLVDNWDSEDFRERKIEEEMMKLRN